MTIIKIMATLETVLLSCADARANRAMFLQHYRATRLSFEGNESTNGLIIAVSVY